MPSSDSNAPEQVVEVFNAAGRGGVLVLCEHASHHIPVQYEHLGLAVEDRRSHAAWDPGARAVALALATALDGPMVASKVSRLVYDCNRPPTAPSAMPEKSEVIEVPGNRNLSQADRDQRTQQVYAPFCTVVSDILAQRKSQGLETAIVTMHSFTPVYHGTRRRVEIGILHDSDSRLADAMLAQATLLPQRLILRNDPYGPDDGVTHSLKEHGLRHGLANVMIEVRNDLLQTEDQEARMAAELLTLLRPALALLQTGGPANA